jgi:tetratricopeptide (TPR) repeat protein
MNHRVNVVAVLILAGGFAALSVGVHFLHAYQVKRNARGLYDEALVFEEKGEPAKAAEYLEQYLGLEPGDDIARGKYGMLLAQRAQTRRQRTRAYYVLEQVLRREPNSKPIRRQVARMATLLGQLTDARHHLSLLLKDAPDDAELCQLMGRCAVAELKFDDAEDGTPGAETWYTKAIKLAPDRVDLALEYAGLLRHLMKVPAIANSRIEEMVIANPNSREALARASGYFLRFGMVDKAEKHVRNAMELMEKPGLEDAEILLLAADVARFRNKPYEAAKYLERARKRDPKDARIVQAMAQQRILDGDKKRAADLLQESLKNLPSDPEQLMILAGMFLQAGVPDWAEQVTSRLGQLKDQATKSCVEAHILMHKESWGAARQILEKLTDRKLPPHLVVQVPYLLGVCYEQLGNPDQRQAAFQQAVNAAPSIPAVRRALALALLALGKVDLAIKEYQTAASQNALLRGELAQLLIAHIARLPAAKQRWDEVERLVKELETAGDGAPEVPLLRAQLLTAQGKLDQARKLTEAERNRHPEMIAPWLYLAALAQRQGKDDAILSLLDDAEKSKAGRKVEWQLARASYWIRRGGKEEAAQELAKLQTSLDQFAEPDQVRLLRGLAESFDSLGDARAADSLWRQVAQRQPNDLGVHFLLFDRNLAAGRNKDAQQEARAIRRIEGDEGPLTGYAEAAQLLAKARAADQKQLADLLKDLRTHLAMAVKLRPSWSRLAVLEGEAFELENRKDKALEKYQLALERGDRRVALVRRVLDLLTEQQRYTEAQALISTLPEQALETRDLGQIAAALAFLKPGKGDGRVSEEQQKALERARKAAASKPTDYRDQLALGQVAAALGHAEEAETAFRQACQLADTEPNTWAALILFLAARDAKKAEVELNAARQKLPKDRLPAVLAAGYEALGKTKDAEEQFIALLTAKPSDPAILAAMARFYLRTGSTAKAEAPLRKLIDPQLKAPETVAAWARRELAVVLAGTGSYAQFREAIALLDARPSKKSESLEDRQARCLILATQPAHRSEAIALLQGLPDQGTPNSPNVQYLLARLLEADGNWARARDLLSALATDHGKNPAFIASFARSLLSHKETEAAKPWVAKLIELAPRDLETLELRVRLLKEQGKAQDAAQVIQEYLRDKDARRDAAAFLMEEIGRTVEAEALYRSIAAASKAPEAMLALAGHLSRLNRRHLAEALDLCEKARKTCPPEKVATATLVVLRAGSATEEQYKRVDDWFTDLLVQPAASRWIAGAYGELLDGRGSYADAMRYYRKALEQDPKNVVAMNNLAYLLVMHDRKPAEALQLAQKAIEGAGPHPEMLDTRALIQICNGKADKAIADLKLAIAQAPTPAMYLHLAQAHQLAKDTPAATEAFRKAQESGLQAASLHPLERPYFQDLAAALK